MSGIDTKQTYFRHLVMLELEFSCALHGRFKLVLDAQPNTVHHFGVSRNSLTEICVVAIIISAPSEEAAIEWASSQLLAKLFDARLHETSVIRLAHH